MKPDELREKEDLELARQIMEAFEGAAAVKKERDDLARLVEELGGALEKLYEYTVSVEKASGGLLIAHGGRFPDGGEEAGELTRAALASLAELGER